MKEIKKFDEFANYTGDEDVIQKTLRLVKYPMLVSALNEADENVKKVLTKNLSPSGLKKLQKAADKLNKRKAKTLEGKRKVIDNSKWAQNRIVYKFNEVQKMLQEGTYPSESSIRWTSFKDFLSSHLVPSKLRMFLLQKSFKKLSKSFLDMLTGFDNLIKFEILKRIYALIGKIDYAKDITSLEDFKKLANYHKTNHKLENGEYSYWTDIETNGRIARSKKNIHRCKKLFKVLTDMIKQLEGDFKDKPLSSALSSEFRELRSIIYKRVLNTDTKDKKDIVIATADNKKVLCSYIDGKKDSPRKLSLVDIGKLSALDPIDENHPNTETFVLKDDAAYMLSRLETIWKSDNHIMKDTDDPDSNFKYSIDFDPSQYDLKIFELTRKTKQEDSDNS